MQAEVLDSTLIDLHQRAIEKINYGETLVESTKSFTHLEGLQKLQRKLKQELNFLKKVLKNKTVKKEHLQCSNLTHIAAVLNTLNTVDKCTNISKVFVLGERKITVDIVCDNGLTWMKVIARNPKSISQICMGNASYGVRSILDQAEEYIECAKLYPCLFQTPKIVFVFASGVSNNLSRKLESYGIIVQGERLTELNLAEDYEEDEEDCSRLSTSNNTDLTTKNISHITKVNLDVSAMLVYCSSVTNGSANLYEFSTQVLAQQAKWEAERPQKTILEEFFKGKKLYCCQTAMDSFINIVNMVGGPNEQIRAKEFIKLITVLPDDATAEDTIENSEDGDIFSKIQYTSTKSIKIGGKIRKRSLIVFMFGDRIKAVTVTANDGFVRATKQQGINFVVFLHESRALSEQKELTRAKLKHNV